MPKVTFELDGVLYRDYDLYVNDGTLLELESCKYIIGESLFKHLEDLDINIDESLFPAHGDKIYVSPNCPIATADIRNNFTIKRNYDDPEIVCNVMSPITTWVRQTWCYAYALFDKDKILIVDNDWFQNRTISEICQALGYDVNRADKVKRRVSTAIGFGSTEFLKLYGLKCHESYIKYLFGELQKPCIRYTQLKLNQDNPPTLDILKLVYNIGKSTDVTNNALQNFTTQLMALNQYSWRDYPKTIDILFDIMRQPKTVAMSAYLGRRSSPKPIKELLSFYYEGSAKSQEDFDLAQQFIVDLLGIENKEFVSTEDLVRHVEENNIDFDLFSEFFNNITRIKLKQYAK